MARPHRVRRGRFSHLSVEELRALYEKEIGRPTSSTDRKYLEWKLREVVRPGGTVKHGPAPVRLFAGQETVMIPWRLPQSVIDDLARAAQRLDFTSRSAMLRSALAQFLEEEGESQLAVRVMGVESGNEEQE